MAVLDCRNMKASRYLQKLGSGVGVFRQSMHPVPVSVALIEKGGWLYVHLTVLVGTSGLRSFLEDSERGTSIGSD